MATLPLLPTRIIRPINMLLHIQGPQPRTLILLKSLNSRLELRLLQRKIIDGANPRDTSPRVPRTPPIHERAAHTAEAILHVVTRSNRFVLAKTSEFVLATEVLQMRVFDDEVGGEHAINALSQPAIFNTLRGTTV